MRRAGRPVAVLSCAVAVLSIATVLLGAAGGVRYGGKGVSKNTAGQWIVSDETVLSADPVNPGQSVVGPNALAAGLTIESSGGNAVVYVGEGAVPAAYGASNTTRLVNGCLGPGANIVDIGSASYAYAATSRKHTYGFVFASPISTFSALILDWGDYLPYGACTGGRCGIVATAYNGSTVVATQEAGFTSTSTAAFSRPSDAGNLSVAGDACTATPGQPGRMPITITGANINRVTIAFANPGSIDPNIAVQIVRFE